MAQYEVDLYKPDPVRDAALELRAALDLCVGQMEQCEKLFADDEAFAVALEGGRAALAKAGGA